jgi:hypothetical protein
LENKSFIPDEKVVYKGFQTWYNQFINDAGESPAGSIKLGGVP